MICQNYTSLCKEFHQKPYINPATGRKIQINGGTYMKYVNICGQPTSINVQNVQNVQQTFIYPKGPEIQYYRN